MLSLNVILILPQYPPKQCNEVAMTHSWKEFSLTEHEPGFFTTNRSLELEYKWCCYTFETSITNLIVEVGSVSTMDGITLMSGLGDVSHCNPNQSFLRYTVWSCCVEFNRNTFSILFVYSQGSLLSSIYGFSYFGRISSNSRNYFTICDSILCSE